MPKTYQIEKILDKKLVNNKAYYLIKWEGFSHKDCTWEPLENIQHVISNFEFDEAAAEVAEDSQQYSSPVPDIKDFINPKIITRSSLQKYNQNFQLSQIQSQPTQRKTQNKQQIVYSKKSNLNQKKQSQNQLQEPQIQQNQEIKQVEEQQIKATSTQLAKEVNTRKLLRRRIRGVLNPFEEQLDALIQNVRKQLKTEVLGLFEHNDTMLDPNNNGSKVMVSKEVQTDTRSDPIVVESDRSLQRQSIQEFIQYFSQIQGPQNKNSQKDVQQHQNEVQEIPTIENNKQKGQEMPSVVIQTIEQTNETFKEIQKNSQEQKQLRQQEIPVLNEVIQEISKIQSNNGSFLKGNKIQTIVKGIVDQKDGVRKYLVKWVQEEGKNLKDSWINEYALLDFACKDLAKFFLSRIKWGPK